MRMWAPDPSSLREMRGGVVWVLKLHSCRYKEAIALDPALAAAYFALAVAYKAWRRLACIHVARE